MEKHIYPAPWCPKYLLLSRSAYCRPIFNSLPHSSRICPAPNRHPATFLHTLTLVSRIVSGQVLLPSRYLQPAALPTSYCWAATNTILTAQITIYCGPRSQFHFILFLHQQTGIQTRSFIRSLYQNHHTNNIRLQAPK